ncbi:hypothetical protein F183_A19400 [Bryobacterales bacterium F-183]|nr:hypothetical protein F183_A19400 [Bryobacterales bacterium F-183]
MQANLAFLLVLGLLLNAVVLADLQVHHAGGQNHHPHGRNSCDPADTAFRIGFHTVHLVAVTPFQG